MQVLNDVLSFSKLRNAQNILMKPHWGFGFISTDPMYPIWNFDKKFGKSIVDDLMQHDLLKDYTLKDYHINGQTCMMDGSVHQDNAGDITHAFVFFPYQWSTTWGGRLTIFGPDGESVITPKENTGVLFDASWPHYAEGTTFRAHNRLRVSVGLKLVAKVPSV